LNTSAVDERSTDGHYNF